MDEKILKLACKKNVYYKTRKAIKRLKDKGFKILFNGENFDLIDSDGHLLTNYGSGINLDQLVEYSLLEHYFTIGEKVEITAERTRMIVPEIYDTYKHEIGDIGIIEGITFGSAYGLGESLLFNIRNFNKEWMKSYIPGDFKAI